MMKALIPSLALLILNLADGAPTKTKYVLKGYGASAYFNWQEEGCDYGSYVGLSAEDNVSKVQSNGKPETTTREMVDMWYEHWYDCSSDSVTHTFLSIDDATPTSVDIKTNLKSASMSSTFRALVVTQDCGFACDTYECGDDGGETCTYCYPVCTEEGSVSKEAEVTVEATLVGTSTWYTSTSRYTSSTPDGFSDYKYSGRTVDATVSAISITVDDDALSIPSNADKYANIFKVKEGLLTKYRDVK
jgi:hypothetical protein